MVTKLTMTSKFIKNVEQVIKWLFDEASSITKVMAAKLGTVGDCMSTF